MNNIIKKLMITAIGCLVIPSGTALANGNLLDKIFTLDMIQNKKITDLEKLTGKPLSSDKFYKTNTYQLNGCYITAKYNEQYFIQSLHLLVTNQCSFNIEPLYEGNGNTPANKLTLGYFNGSYYADCIYMCGNAVEPSLYKIETIYPPRYTHMNGYDILVSSSTSKSNDWAEAMIKKEGEDWVRDNKFNCYPEKYNDLANKLLKDEPIQEITIGYDLLEGLRLQTDCH